MAYGKERGAIAIRIAGYVSSHARIILLAEPTRAGSLAENAKDEIKFRQLK